jgi:hypothetical protein
MSSITRTSQLPGSGLSFIQEDRSYWLPTASQSAFSFTQKKEESTVCLVDATSSILSSIAPFIREQENIVDDCVFAMKNLHSEFWLQDTLQILAAAPAVQTPAVPLV